MAEAIVYGIAQKILTDLSSLALKEIAIAVGVKQELKKLESTLSTIKDVLLDAEDQHLSNHEVRSWLRRIKDAAYDADDILDEFATEALRQKFVVRESTMKRVGNFFSSSNSTVFRIKIGHRIRDIQEKLDNIAADKIKFHLLERVREDTRDRSVGREQTHSFVVESEVFGRDNDREEIMKLLLDVDVEGNLSVVIIQGMGGLGKTTLAQLVYNDTRIDVFEQRMWVCVSEDFNVEKLAKKIIESATKDECPHLGIDLLQSRLRDILKGKRFLIVLDDVWNENDDKWYKLKCLLVGGAKGSKVIVTTRSEKVSSIMGTVPMYHLKGLTDVECRSLFKQRAFASRREEEHQNLAVIGDEIVSKCRGVPLAAKTLGSVLRFRTEEREWALVRNSELWNLPQEDNGVLPALRLSYNHLQPHLKQCFAYCSIFPKDHRINKEMLIQLWVAQGFVHSLDENRCLEDIGNECVNDLWCRSFLQEPVVDYYGNLISFKMHDLMHDLAQSVAGTECFIFETRTGKTIPKGVRHLCVNDYCSYGTFRDMRKPLNLRTLVFQSEFYRFSDLPNDILPIFTSLRVLVLSRLEDSYESSKYIRKLKHLRYLELYSTHIRTLPEFITQLRNLQTLKLPSYCQLKELPNDIGKMTNLRHIQFLTCPLLSHMPPGLGQLVALQTLPLFVVGKDIGCKLNELGRMVHLRGKLSITNLENVSSAADSAEADLKGKQNLEILKLLWNKVDNGDVGMEGITTDVLQNLEPHPYLKKLKIESYRGARFPSWMMDPLLLNLVKITLSECSRCQNLPPFGDLPSLQVLKLVGMESLRFIEGGLRKEWFPSLKVLSLKRVPNLEKWAANLDVHDDNNDGDNDVDGTVVHSLVSLPCLVELSLYDCAKLTTMPVLPLLEKLHIGKCSQKLVNSLLKGTPRDSLTSSPYSLARLKLLKVEECDNLVSFLGTWYLAALQSLHLSNCKEMHILEGMNELTSLQTLEIDTLPKLASLPEELKNVTTLQSISISDCESLNALPPCLGSFTSLRKLRVWLCPMLQSLPDEMQHLTTLQIFSIEHCFGLTSWPSWLGSFTTLTDLSISCSSNLPSLPEEMQHLTALLSLCIHGGEDATLPEWMGNFTSLKRLYITGFPNLQYLPEWMHGFTALQELRIHSCDLLISRCNKETGEDWPKIAHVPWIVVEGELI